MKKLISFAAAAALAVTALSGCTAEDMALIKALQNVPETSVTTTRATFDVTVDEPFTLSADPFDDKISNYILKAMGGLLSVTEAEEVVVKSGNRTESKSTYTMPDASFTFTSWVETDAQNNPVKAVVSLPSYVRPFLPEALSAKHYLTYDVKQLMGAIFGYSYAYVPEAENDAAFGVIGGADGPTSVYTADAGLAAATVPGMLSGDALAELAAQLPNVKLVTATSREGSNTVYTVTVNGDSLTAMLAGFATDLGGGTDEAAAQANMYADLIKATGLLDEGLTMKFTVNPSGNVIRTETDMTVTLDMARYFDALQGMYSTSVMPEEGETAAEALDMIKPAGKFRIAAHQVSEVTDIGRPVTVNFPTLTDENTIDYAKDMTDYMDYARARIEWELGGDEANDAYHEVAAYAKTLKPGNKIILRNDVTGVEVETEPITTADVYPDEDDGFMSMYLPLANVAATLPGISYEWNEELQGIEVRYTDVDGNESYTLYPTETGADMYLTAVYGEDGNSDNQDTVYSKYTYVDTYGLYYNDLFYVEYDMFNRDLGYQSHFDGNKYRYSPVAEREPFDDSSMKGNFLYELENMFK